MLDATLLEKQLLAWREDLHRYPELSSQEFETTEKIKQWLSEYGIQHSGWGLKTGVIAEIGSGQPITAIRADIDALPIHEEAHSHASSQHQGVMHACGHDLHCSAILGAAILLKARESELSGTVRVIFQPAEETYSGAYEVIKSGALDDVSAIFGFHNVPELEVDSFATRSGAFYANVDKFKILIKGQGGHAGLPHLAKDSILSAAQFINSVQSISSRTINNLETCIVSITQIHGGTSWNVLPESVFLEGTVRTHSDKVRSQVEQRIRQIASGIAQANELSIDVEIDHGPTALINTPVWAEFSKKIAVEHGYKVQDAPLYLIGEDFGAYLDKTPGAFISLGSASPYGLHHPKYQPDETLILPAAQYFADLAQQALDFIKNNNEVLENE